ncbi:MFS transporter [Nonomuraea deserti]|uniref:MFS transporter n=1 Tax=Nonomuraea deserti TaxID=1848322 RepID=A0A4R4VMS4_9ACTN|nr:MFS transporter [Nonomuraea deserti]TDD03704.1 MFS transporter [Nonomuraea deserti]
MSIRTVVTVVASGGAASMALGEFVPFLTSVSVEFDLSLTAVGLLSSAVTLVAGLTCLPLGLWVDRHQLRGVFVAGLVALGVAGLAAPFAGGAEALFALRAIQAAGYALVVITGPSLLARLLDGRSRQTALALWGLCVPSGLALAGAGGGLAPGWRAEVAGVGAITVVVAALAWTLPRDARPGREDGRGGSRRGPGTMWPVAALAAGFAMIALVGVSVVTVLPAYLTAELSVPGSQAGPLAGLVSAASVLGSLAAGAALRAGTRPRRLIIAALLMMPLTAGVFLQAPVAVAAVCAAGVLAVNGLAVSAVFAALPAVAGDRIAWGVGAVTQSGSLGTLLGAPAYLWVVEMGGWSWVTVLTAAIVTGGVCCATAALGGRLR